MKRAKTNDKCHPSIDLKETKVFLGAVRFYSLGIADMEVYYMVFGG
jgi:hypothetical protein